jgi:hypothetical protein
VYVYGIWWIGVYMVANPNSTFAPWRIYLSFGT